MLLLIAGVAHALFGLCIFILPDHFSHWPRAWASAGGFSGVVMWLLKKFVLVFGVGRMTSFERLHTAVCICGEA